MRACDFRLSLVLGALLAFVGCGGSSPGGSAGTGGSGGSAGAGAKGGTGGQKNTGGSAGGAAGHDAGAADGGAATTFAVGGTVTGLAGSGLTLQDGAGNQLSVTANGAFTFATKLAAGTNVSVTVGASTVDADPDLRGRRGDGRRADRGCHQRRGHLYDGELHRRRDGRRADGVRPGSAGQLRGRPGGERQRDLRLRDAGLERATYTVSVKTQPASPLQTCQVSGGSGTIGADDVTSVAINCAVNKYTIGGTVGGLVGTGLVLQNNAGRRPVRDRERFVRVRDVGGERRRVRRHGQDAAVVAGAGLLGQPGERHRRRRATSRPSLIVCATDSYTVGGMVTGLGGSGLVLQDNLGDNLSVTAAGSFTFATAVADGSVVQA